MPVAYLGRHLPGLLLLLRFLLLTQHLPSLRVPDYLPPFHLFFRVLRLLQRRLHVPCQADLPNDRQEPLPAKYCTEHFLGIDVPALGRALFGPELVVFLAEVGVGEGLVGNGDLFEAVFSEWVIWILVGMVFNCKAACVVYVLVTETGIRLAVTPWGHCNICFRTTPVTLASSQIIIRNSTMIESTQRDEETYGKLS